VILALLLAFLSYNANAETKNNSRRFQFDIQGDFHYSRYNFTDIKEPYNGYDGWVELKLAYWLDDNKSIAPYVDVIPTGTSEDEFWWQKNVQYGLGLQWYPVDFYHPPPKSSDTHDSLKSLRGFRLFVLLAAREYYDRPEGTSIEDKDIQIGTDFFYESIFEDKKHSGSKKLGSVVWSYAGYRQTNFSKDDYKAFLWTGNAKLGLKFWPLDTLFPYAVVDWTYVPKYDEDWWSNFIRAGAGLRWYPTKMKNYSPFLKRLNIYAEFQHNVVWLGDKPSVDIEETDFRIGCSFSTGGFFKE
jgi:hypothetical protein